MAYLSFIETAAGAAVPAEVHQIPNEEGARFSALEWSVVAIAEGDPLSSLRSPGRVAQALGSLFPAKRNPKLADPKLEALRRMAVLTWKQGYKVSDHAITAFLNAGFTTSQYELLAGSIVTARAKRRLSRKSQ